MNTPRILLSLFAIMVGIGHIAVILVYFVRLLRDNDPEFVSDLLSSDPLYVNIMTFFVLLQFTACFGFVRLCSSTSTRTRVIIESMFLAVSWIGWCILIVRYRTYGQLSNLHFLGVGLFVSGGVVYFAFLIWEIYSMNTNAYANFTLLLLYILAIVLGFLFILGYFAGWGSSWVFEHCAFMLFTAAHIFLFCIEVEETLVIDTSSSQTSLFEDVRIRCFSDNTPFGQ